MGIDNNSLNEVVFNDYLYKNPQVHNSAFKETFDVLFKTIDHDDLIRNQYFRDIH